MDIPFIEIGTLPKDPVAPDALQGIRRQQTHPSRWQGENWPEFAENLQNNGITVEDNFAAKGVYVTDAGGLAHSMPHGIVKPKDAQQIAYLLQQAQHYRVPVTTRGGGLTTEGESVAYGGVVLDMTAMSEVLAVDPENLTVRVQAGIFWHSLAEVLRRQNLDYLSAPLNMTSTVGGSLGVGGIDVNSAKFGCSADQTLSVQVVTPTGEIVECSDEENPELFQRVILGYGQFGVITEATLKIRPFTPAKMHYFYYRNLRTAIKDLHMLDRNEASDYSGILTVMDRTVNLLVAFDSDEKEKVFLKKWRRRLRGHGEFIFALRAGLYYLFHPWRLNEALFLWDRKRRVFPELQRSEYMRDGKLYDRTVLFSRAVWNFWGNRQMVIPDLATNTEKFVTAVEKGNQVCKKYFSYYALYCVGIKLRPEHKTHYEMSSIPMDAEGWAYGCEFEPLFEGETFSRDYIQSFKNEIYDVGVELNTSYYRFGGLMKGYIRRVFEDELVDKHLAMKRQADPAMILNRDVIF